MASITIVPSRPRAERRELSESMDRVLEELKKVRSSPDSDNVHDLRVAIRRCRSVATVFEEIDPDPSWRAMRHTAKKLFRALGTLRDAHVMEEWIRKLTPPNDPVRVHMHSLLESEEPQLREEVLRVAGKFDGKAWKSAHLHLHRRVRLIPVGGLAAECLAWERFEEVKLLHSHALRNKKPWPWHELRIGLKKLRYTVESLLPAHHEAWSENLKRLQDLLGDIHDLDVLADRVKAETAIPGISRKAWKAVVQQERHKRVQTYRQLTLGKTSVLNKWRHALPHGERLEAASFARLQAAARAASARSPKASRVARISLRLFDLLRRAKAAPVFSDASLRRNLRAAGLLHAVGHGHKHPAKTARKFLLQMTVAPRWSRDEWDLVAWAVRFHRGAEPAVADEQFGELTAAEQQKVRALAGLLRLARALVKIGVTSPKQFKTESSTEALTLLVPDLPDTLQSAAEIAAGKHLLETATGKPLVVRPGKKPLELVAPLNSTEQKTLYAVAGASD